MLLSLLLCHHLSENRPAMKSHKIKRIDISWRYSNVACCDGGKATSQIDEKPGSNEDISTVDEPATIQYNRTCRDFY